MLKPTSQSSIYKKNTLTTAYMKTIYTLEFDTETFIGSGVKKNHLCIAELLIPFG
jgi:hypothetical protein